MNNVNGKQQPKTNGTADETAANQAAENTAEELKEEALSNVAGGVPSTKDRIRL